MAAWLSRGWLPWRPCPPTSIWVSTKSGNRVLYRACITRGRHGRRGVTYVCARKPHQRCWSGWPSGVPGRSLGTGLSGRNINFYRVDKNRPPKEFMFHPACLKLPNRIHAEWNINPFKKKNWGDAWGAARSSPKSLCSTRWVRWY